MPEFILSIIAVLRVFFCSRSDTALEILALRQQVAVLKRKRPRPTANSLDRLFWTTLRRCWSRWTDVLVIVKPETVIGCIAPAFVSTGVGVHDRGAIGRRTNPLLKEFARRILGKPGAGHHWKEDCDPA